MRNTLFFAFVILPIFSWAQLDFEMTTKVMIRKWVPGGITLSDREEMQAELRLDLVNSPDQIELRKLGLIYSIPFDDLKEFWLYDSLSSKVRSFTVAKLKDGRCVAAEYEFRKSVGGIVIFRDVKTTVTRSSVGVVHAPVGANNGFSVGVGSGQETRHSEITEDPFIFNSLTREALPLSARNLLKVFHPQRDEIKKFLKKEKIKFSVYKDYLRVIAYIETLLTPNSDSN